MRTFVLALVMCLGLYGWGKERASAKSRGSAGKERIAVLDLKNRSGAKDSEVSYLTSLLRQAASRLPTSRFSVMTKDNILVLLPPGTRIEDCVGTCAVDTGRRLQAQWVLVGEVVRFGSSLRVILNLHHSKSGELRKSETVKGENFEKLEGPLQGAALELFSILDPSLKRVAKRLKGGFVFEKFQYKPLPELPSIGDVPEEHVEERFEDQIEDQPEEKEQVTQPLAIPSSPKATVIKGIDFGNVDVEGLALYDEALRLDEDESIKPELKAVKWDAVAARVKGVKAQAEARAEVWRNFIVERDRRAEVLRQRAEKARQRVEEARQRVEEARRRAEQKRLEKARRKRLEKERVIKELMKLKAEDAALERKRRTQMEKDWAKLSKLIGLRVVSPEDKLNWVEAFVEAYGAVSELNPHIGKLSQWTEKMGDRFDAFEEEGEREAERRTRRQGEIEAKLNSLRGFSVERGDEYIKYTNGQLSFRMKVIPAGGGVTSFLMAETEVTQELYEAVMGSNPSSFTGDVQRPVERLTWYDMVSFCNALSTRLNLTPVYQGSGSQTTMDKSANGFRLPFENEWEWAARGGQNFTYAGSYNLDDVAWHGKNSRDSTHPVGQKQANGYGLFDLSGNVGEWCNDDYDSPGEYRSGASRRVLRGGGWRHDDARSFHVAYRNHYLPTIQLSYLGGRVARSVR